MSNSNELKFTGNETSEEFQAKAEKLHKNYVQERHEYRVLNNLPLKMLGRSYASRDPTNNT